MGAVGQEGRVVGDVGDDGVDGGWGVGERAGGGEALGGRRGRSWEGGEGVGEEGAALVLRLRL